MNSAAAEDSLPQSEMMGRPGGTKKGTVQDSGALWIFGRR